jgi:nucleoside-diphosphate-sugar epimerase
MRVLLTGSDGYLGCLAGPALTRAGHEVTGVDTGFYRSGWLYAGVDLSVRTLHRDVRQLSADDLRGVDAVVHMAELSNDPLGDLLGQVTYAVNHRASVRLAELAKQAGVERFVHMSSCSVYGIADGTVDETSPVTPQTAYAECKALVERDVSALADDTFSPTFLRNATAFGASPRMRFDIVLNNLCGLAWTTGEIAMSSDGSPWRPLVHTLDIAEAIRCVLEAPREAVHAEVLNVGSDEQNYQVRDIAQRVAAAFPGCSTTFGPPSPDNRSYRVDFSKIRRMLPSFRCAWDADAGSRQLREVFSRVQLDEATFTGRGHTRLAQLEHLLATRQLGADLFWATP